MATHTTRIPEAGAATATLIELVGVESPTWSTVASRSTAASHASARGARLFVDRGRPSRRWSGFAGGGGGLLLFEGGGPAAEEVERLV